MKVFLRFISVGLALTFMASLGCASSGAARQDEDQAAVQKAWNDRRSHIRAASDQGDDPSSEMAVSGDEGTVNAADVESAISQHRDELLDCYGLGRRNAQRAGGRALLRFFVDGKGEVVDVAILESNIGNQRIERCLADIAVGVTLHPPTGHKPTTFDYPVEFRLSARRSR